MNPNFSLLLATSAIPLISPIYVGHLLFVILFFWHVLVKENNNPIKILNIFLLLSILIFLILKILSTNSEVNFDRVAQHLLLISATVFFIFQMKNYDVEKFYNSLIFVSFLNCTVLAIQSFFWIEENGLVYFSLQQNEFFRIKGIFASPVESSTFLVVGFAALISSRTFSRQKIFLSIFLLFFILISFSRSAYIGLCVIILFQVIRSLFSKNMRNITLYFSIVLVLAIVVMSVDVFKERVADIGNIGFNIKRFIVWNHVIQEWLASPESLMLGFPLGDFVFYHPIDKFFYDNIHNSYLDILYNYGLIGMFIFLIFLFLLAVKVFLICVHKPSEGAVYALVVSVLAVINFVDTIYLSVSLFLVHAFVIARLFETKRLKVGG